ncbi:putative Dual specificity protein phosphatase 14 [Hypsibius exemplaris]|uniref:Dual specificity protein phosphatase 14 n=1 Tax=Hypsibius exemplaris TaxID=2072580 RepID=A0A1W0WE95_HYPEX|nr:putative Dual specificity protein phosphatase 14 [Hypsibius exemplaris]
MESETSSQKDYTECSSCAATPSQSTATQSQSTATPSQSTPGLMASSIPDEGKSAKRTSKNDRSWLENHLKLRQTSSAPEIYLQSFTRGSTRGTSSFHRADPIIEDFLYLSGASGVEEGFLRARGITCVINCAYEVDNNTLERIEYLDLEMRDVPEFLIESSLHAGADKIEEHRLAGGKVLVHCMMGMSRSAAVTLAYLVKYQGKSLREAHVLVRERRTIRPNNGFWRQLIDFERDFTAECSVTMVRNDSGQSVADIYIHDRDVDVIAL